MEDWEQEILNKIDNKEKLDRNSLKTLVFEWGIQTEYGEPRRWSRSAITISQIEDRYFLTQWDCGLTEYQENEFYEEPEEVFPKEETILVPEHYETKKWWETKDKEKFTMEGNK